jgi:hypothetical protein
MLGFLIFFNFLTGHFSSIKNSFLSQRSVLISFMLQFELLLVSLGGLLLLGLQSLKMGKSSLFGIGHHALKLKFGLFSFGLKIFDFSFLLI